MGFWPHVSYIIIILLLLMITMVVYDDDDNVRDNDFDDVSD